MEICPAVSSVIPDLSIFAFHKLYIDESNSFEFSLDRLLQEDSRAKQLRIDTARNIWGKRVALKGTLGEKYLVEHRQIPEETLPRYATREAVRRRNRPAYALVY